MQKKNRVSIIKQLMPALKVNIIIVHPWDVVFPRALAFYFSPRENKISRH
jgi:hypothetical protein